MVVHTPGTDFTPPPQTITVKGQIWPCRTHAVVVLNKPAGYECSQAPSHHPSVYSLLPEPLRRRGVQAVGRLDAETVGLLILTDCGALNHRLTSPKTAIEREYHARCAAGLPSDAPQRLRNGLVLRGENQPSCAHAAHWLGDDTLSVTLRQGRYHEVRRLIAALGSRVTHLQRVRFGNYYLPADLAAGEWRWLGDDEVLQLECKNQP